MTSKSEYTQTWRAKREEAEPGYLAREREAARVRSAERRAAKKDDPEHQEKMRTYHREYRREARKNPEVKAREAEFSRQYRLRPDYAEEQRERMAKWRSENAEQIAAYQTVWKEENREHLLGYAREYNSTYYHQEHAVAARHVQRVGKYGLTPDQFNQMWSEQNGLCLICEHPMEPRGRSNKSSHIDHNHETGEVRGILCRGCNHGLGNFGDDPAVLQAAVYYLLEHGSYGKSE